jgi:hypothetical protein
LTTATMQWSKSISPSILLLLLLLLLLPPLLLLLLLLLPFYCTLLTWGCCGFGSVIIKDAMIEDVEVMLHLLLFFFSWSLFASRKQSLLPNSEVFWGASEISLLSWEISLPTRERFLKLQLQQSIIKDSERQTHTKEQRRENELVSPNCFYKSFVSMT